MFAGLEQKQLSPTFILYFVGFDFCDSVYFSVFLFFFFITGANTVEGLRGQWNYLINFFSNLELKESERIDIDLY